MLWPPLHTHIWTRQWQTQLLGGWSSPSFRIFLPQQIQAYNATETFHQPGMVVVSLHLWMLLSVWPMVPFHGCFSWGWETQDNYIISSATVNGHQFITTGSFCIGWLLFLYDTFSGWWFFLGHLTEVIQITESTHKKKEWYYFFSPGGGPVVMQTRILIHRKTAAAQEGTGLGSDAKKERRK